MQSKKILILGGGRYNVPSIAAAREAGFFTIVADKNAEAPGLKVADHGLAIDVNDCESLVAAVKHLERLHGVVSMAEVGVRAAAQISARLGLRSISEEAAANATSKAAMRRCWKQIGRYSPAFRVVATLEEARRAASQLGRFPMILKPDRSFGGSRGVSRIDSIEQIATAFETAKSGGLPDSDVVIEHCIDGTEHSCEVLIWHGKTSVLCIGQKVKSVPPYRVDVSVQYPAELTPEQEESVADMCQQAINALGLTQGVAHVEFGYGAHGPVLFEAGARCGGGHTPQIAHHVSGVNEFVESCRMACGMAPSQFASSARRGADYRFLVFPPGTVAAVFLPPHLEKDPSVLDIGFTVGPGDIIAPLQNTSQRAGFVVTVADNLAGAVDRADRACREICIQYAGGSKCHALELDDFRELAH